MFRERSLRRARIGILTRSLADAEAICEAVARPSMRFVRGKTAQQQAILAVHRPRQGFVKARTAQANQILGLLSEFGLVIPQGISHIAKQIPRILEDAENGLPDTMRPLIARLAAHLGELDRQVDELEAQIQTWHRQNAESRRLSAIPGIGPLTASALVASIGDAKTFDNGRQMATWLGLVPRQHSSGGNPTLLGVSQARRCLSSYAARSRGAGRGTGRRTPNRPYEYLGEAAAPSAPQKRRCRDARQ